MLNYHIYSIKFRVVSSEMPSRLQPFVVIAWRCICRCAGFGLTGMLQMSPRTRARSHLRDGVQPPAPGFRPQRASSDARFHIRRRQRLNYLKSRPIPGDGMSRLRTRPAICSTAHIRKGMHVPAPVRSVPSAPCPGPAGTQDGRMCVTELWARRLTTPTHPFHLYRGRAPIPAARRPRVGATDFGRAVPAALRRFTSHGQKNANRCHAPGGDPGRGSGRNPS